MDQSFITSPYFYKHITCRAGQISYSFFSDSYSSVCLYFMGSTKQLTYPQAASLVIRKTRKIRAASLNREVPPSFCSCLLRIYPSTDCLYSEHCEKVCVVQVLVLTTTSSDCVSCCFRTRRCGRRHCCILSNHTFHS